jgi:hypothetical protein
VTAPEFPAGTEFLVSWEMPPATVTAYDYEDLYGRDVWLRLTAQQWEALPWKAASGHVTTDYDNALDQYRQLAAWADSHEQPIRNVKLEQRRPPEWTPVDVPPAGPPNPAPNLAGDWLGPVRTWCCGTSAALPHAPDCSFRATPDNPIDYNGPVDGPTYGGRYA